MILDFEYVGNGCTVNENLVKVLIRINLKQFFKSLHKTIRNKSHSSYQP